MLSTSTAGSPSAFDVLAQTTNGPLTATIASPNAGTPPRLHAALRTSCGPARVALSHAFAGTFELRGFPFLPPAVEARPVPGRRIERTAAGMGMVAGRVVLHGAEGREGRVTVETSNAPLLFSL